MLAIKVSVPIACFRKGLAREFLETHEIPPPSTCYGFLLSLVGETDRRCHLGVRVSVTLIGEPEQSVVLRTIWRVKSKPLGSSGNTRPDYQQLLSNVELVIWLDSSEEKQGEEEQDRRTLEDRVRTALDPERRHEITRFGGLSLGESTHLVNDVTLVDPISILSEQTGRTFICDPDGLLTLPVWVDHVGAAGTKYVAGSLRDAQPITTPEVERLPKIESFANE